MLELWTQILCFAGQPCSARPPVRNVLLEQKQKMKWTPKEVTLLKQLYCNKKVSYEEIAVALQRSVSAIKTKAHYMRLEYNNVLPVESKVDSFGQWNICSFLVEQMKKKNG